jgi:hypothetical protein
MALSRAANAVEWAIGHNENAITEQDVSNPDRDPDRYGDPKMKMKALVWMGKNSVKIGEDLPFSRCLESYFVSALG